MNPSLSCQSETVKSAFVLDAVEILTTLDGIVEREGELPTIVDRHIAAFIASRYSKDVDRIDKALKVLGQTSGDQQAARLGMLGLYATICHSAGLKKLPHLTAWLAKELSSAADQFQGRTMREYIKDRIDQVANSGNLVELYATLCNEGLLRRDHSQRTAAARQYAMTTREIEKLEGEELLTSARRTGWGVAAGVSALICFATFMILLFA